MSRRARNLLLAGIAVAACAFFVARLQSDGTSTPERSAPSAAAQAADPRVAWLLAPCEPSGYFDVDTSNPLAILGHALIHGQRDPLQRAREELAAEGAPGIAVAARTLETYWEDRARQAHVRNALDVATLSRDPRAREVIVRVLGHPDESVRVLALRALLIRDGARDDARTPLVHGRPEDFDAVLALLSSATEITVMRIVEVLHALDAPRAERLFLDWLAAGEYQPLWSIAVPLLAQSELPEVAAFGLEHASTLAPVLGPFLLAPAARAGNESARATLDAWLASGEQNVRQNAIYAAQAAHLQEALSRALAGDPACQLRLLAARALELEPDSPATRGALGAGLANSCPDVRAVCLQVLCARGDPAAIDRALTDLEGTDLQALQLAMRALLLPMRADPALAERTLARLRERYAAVAGRPLPERAVVLQAIGQVPLRPAAELLLERAERESGDVRGFSAHRSLCLASANTGEAGAPAIAAAFERATDPIARLDLLEALASLPTALARERLLGLLEGESLSPYESLFSCERLAAMGPTRRIAPVMKRVTLRTQHPDVRVALQCLLWRWYAGPR